MAVGVDHLITSSERHAITRTRWEQADYRRREMKLTLVKKLRRACVRAKDTQIEKIRLINYFQILERKTLLKRGLLVRRECVNPDFDSDLLRYCTVSVPRSCGTIERHTPRNSLAPFVVAAVPTL